MHAGVNRAGKAKNGQTDGQRERGRERAEEVEGETRLEPKSMPSEAGALQIHTKWHPRHLDAEREIERAG